MQPACPNCGTLIRPGAKFCARCGQSISASSVPPPYTPPPVNPAQPQAAVQQVAAVVAPAARAAGVAVWQTSRKGMGWFARLVTLGGRAAYTELVSPQATAEGQIVTGPIETQVNVPVEPGLWLFVAAWVLIPALLLLIGQAAGQFALLVGLALLCLILNFIGWRQLAFSRLALGRIFKRPAQPVPELRFQINDAKHGLLQIAILGTRRDGTRLVAGQLVRLYGVLSGTQVRTWKIDVYAADGQPLGLIIAPRILPLAVMLFAPVAVWLIIWVLVLLIP